MNYNFDELIERKNTGCVKWDERPTTLPDASALGLIPLWVADMDFAVAPAIQEAIRQRAQHLCVARPSQPQRVDNPCTYGCCGGLHND